MICWTRRNFFFSIWFAWMICEITLYSACCFQWFKLTFSLLEISILQFQCFCFVSTENCNSIRYQKTLNCHKYPVYPLDDYQFLENSSKERKICWLKSEVEEGKYLKFQKFQNAHNTRMKLLRFASLLGKAAPQQSEVYVWKRIREKRRKKNHEIFYVARLCLCAAQILTLKSNWARSPTFF